VHERPQALAGFGVPAALAGVVERAMAKDPAERYQSASELRDALAAEGGATRAPAATKLPAATRLRKHRRALSAAAALVLAGTGTAVGMSVGGGHERASAHGSAHTAGPAAQPAAGQSTPTTVRASGSTASGDLPPSAGGATSPADVAPATLADTLRSYYALVDQHRLDQSWQWLSPSFQARVGHDYYRQFWDSINQVQVISVRASGGAAGITLRYVGINGATSTETANLGFAIGPDGRLLIDTDRVARG